MERASATTARLAGLILVVLAVTQSGLALARPGEIDPTFGRVGHAVGVGSGPAGATAFALGGDGKSVVGGVTVEPPNIIVGLHLSRYQVDGTLDPSFGTGGTASTLAAPVIGLAIEPGGALVTLEGYPSFGPFLLGRYDANGIPDPGFGSGGSLLLNFAPGSGQYDLVGGLLRQPDGAIVVTGSQGTASTRDLVVARFLADGSPDGTFGSGGIVKTPIAVGTAAHGAALARQSDGSLVVVGKAPMGAFPQLLVARYDSLGVLDPSFGTGGIAIVPEPGFPENGETLSVVAIQPDGKIVAAGRAGVSLPCASEVLRFDAAGSLDPTFGVSGRASTHACRPAGLVLEPGGNIVVGGSGFVDFGYRIRIARHLPNGMPDGSFGTAGRKVIDLWELADDLVGLARQSDGKLVAGVNGTIAAGPDTTGIVRVFGGTCGNGTVEGGEDCDDGNLTPGDGCDAHCCTSDVDGDGECDATDSCVGGVAVQKGVIKAGKFGLDEDVLTVSGKMTLPVPQLPPLDLVANGVRFRLADALGTRIDVAVPPGAFDTARGYGWTARTTGSSTTWTFTDKVAFGVPQKHPPEGIYSVQVRLVHTTGLGKFKLKGRNADSYQAYSQNPPHAFTLVLGPPLYATSQCAEAHFPGPPPAPSCTLSATKLVCK